jgi:hypothetical protein
LTTLIDVGGEMTKIDGIVVDGLKKASSFIPLQKPLLVQHFSGIQRCHDGTINLQLSSPLQVRLPDIVTPPLAWHPNHPNHNERFGITEIELEVNAKRYKAWLYTPEHSPHRFDDLIAEVITETIGGIVTGLKCAIYIRRSRLHQLLVV